MNKLTKYALFLVLISTLSINCVAQNLVPNPSLEDMFDCPETISEFSFPSEAAISVSGWSRPTDATSDYFNSCVELGTTSAIVGTPGNFAGYQEAKNGVGYAGCLCYVPLIGEIDYREYIQTQLATPLIAGHSYFVSYYTSFAEALWDPMAVDQIGAYFSVEAQERTSYLDVLDDLAPQIKSPVGLALDDTATWMQVAGVFTAEGGEEWMIVGNFTPESELNYFPLDGVDNGGYGYYYFDDFCVLDLAMPSITKRTDTMFCPGDEILLAGQEGFSDYFWNDETTNNTKMVSEAGIYWVASIDVATCICRVDTINVLVGVEPLGIDLGKDTLVCKNSPIELTALDEAFTDYRWNTGERSFSISAAYPGTYYVTASSDCYTDSDTIVVSAPAIPKVELPNDIILCEGKELSLGIAMGNLQYQWNTGQDVCCINITESGTYMLTATNICGESDSDDIKVDYSGCDNCILSPTAFSPNGDGLNDLFEVYVNCLMREYKLSIFSRWGQLVFSTVKPDKHWDGLINGKPADVGVYFYYIEATPAIDELDKIVKKGDVTLVR